jgi:hypothetical protein
MIDECRNERAHPMRQLLVLGLPGECVHCFQFRRQREAQANLDLEAARNQSHGQVGSDYSPETRQYPATHPAGPPSINVTTMRASDYTTLLTLR